MSIEIRYGDRSGTAHAHNGKVSVGEITFDVERVGSGLYRVSHEAKHWVIAAAGPPEHLWIWVDGLVAEVETQRDTRPRSRTRSSSHELGSPMPATVLRVLVEPGATVMKGETLLILEAMKMELPVRAPRDGVVRAIHCEPGDLVQPGINLLELE